MQQLDKKNGFYNPWTQFKAWKREKCFCIKNVIYRLTKDMCFTKMEINDINKRVETTNKSEEKFNEWERVAPTIKDFIEQLKREVGKVESEKAFCLEAIRDLYLADLRGDTEMKQVIFAHFGVLDNSKIMKRG